MGEYGATGQGDFRSFLEKEGIPTPQNELIDEEPPEAVSEEKLSAFHRRELAGPEDEWVAFLISRYRAWHEADLRLVEDQGGTDGPSQSIA